MDPVLLTFFLSMLCSVVAVVVIQVLRKPKIRKPIDSPTEKPVTVGI
jgi:hypothetical protein